MKDNTAIVTYIFGIVVCVILLMFLWPRVTMGYEQYVEDVRPEIDLNIVPRKHTDVERKAGSQRMEVLPTPKSNSNESRYMSPPNVTYKTYCINGYVYNMFIVSFGWNPDNGTAQRVETHIQQQFDKYGRGIQCK